MIPATKRVTVRRITWTKIGAAHNLYLVQWFFMTKKVQFNQLVICLLGVRYKWLL